MQHQHKRSEYSEQSPKPVNQYSALSGEVFAAHEFHNEFQENAEGRPHEECGVFGIYAPGVDVANRVVSPTEAVPVQETGAGRAPVTAGLSTAGLLRKTPTISCSVRRTRGQRPYDPEPD